MEQEGRGQDPFVGMDIHLPSPLNGKASPKASSPPPSTLDGIIKQHSKLHRRLVAGTRRKKAPKLSQMIETLAEYSGRDVGLYRNLKEESVRSEYRNLITLCDNYKSDLEALNKKEQQCKKLQREISKKGRPDPVPDHDYWKLTDDEEHMSKMLAKEYGFGLTPECLSTSNIKKLYGDVVCLKKKQRAAYDDWCGLNNKLKNLQSSIGTLEKRLREYNSVNINRVPNIKEYFVELLYRAIPNHVDEDLDRTGGAYAHLTRQSHKILFQELHRLGTIDRKSKMLDIGSGLGVPGWHMATSYCWWAAGVEVDRARCFQAAELAISLLDQGVRNYRVATIFGDIMQMEPSQEATLIYLFDLAFPPALYNFVIEWVARTNARYIVTFKPAREPKKYYRSVLDKLNAEEIGRVNNLVFAMAKESPTAIILERVAAFPTVTPSPKKRKIDACQEVLPLVDLDAKINQMIETPEKTRAAYMDLLATCAPQDLGQRKARLTSPTVFAQASKIHGQGLYASCRVREGATILYSSFNVLGIQEGARAMVSIPFVGQLNTDERFGVINHSCRPNSAIELLKEKEEVIGISLKAIRGIASKEEVTIDYGDTFDVKNCNCGSHCCLRFNKPTVLFLGMVQIATPEEMTAEDSVTYLKQLVDDKTVSQSHARDTLRCQYASASESGYCTYTVDKTPLDNDENTSDTHIVGDFNKVDFIYILLEKQVQVTEVALDYFQSPTDWTKDHWNDTFFSEVIPLLATSNLLRIRGKIFLPFQRHVLAMFQKHYREIRREYIYSVIFQCGWEIDNVLLHSTRKIPKDTMLHFGSDWWQEELLYAKDDSWPKDCYDWQTCIHPARRYFRKILRTPHAGRFARCLVLQRRWPGMDADFEYEFGKYMNLC